MGTATSSMVTASVVGVATAAKSSAARMAIRRDLLKVVDIAGIVAGASKGEGLGNKFLAHIRETQATLHVVRCFEGGDVTHVCTLPASNVGSTARQSPMMTRLLITR